MRPFSGLFAKIKYQQTCNKKDTNKLKEELDSNKTDFDGIWVALSDSELTICFYEE